MKIYPAVLSDSLELVQKQIAEAQDFPDVTTVQIDVIDGKFVENLTITPADLTDTSFGELEVDFHLMTEEPLDYVHELIDYKHFLPIRAVIGQVERMSSQEYFLEEVEKQGWMPGLSLDLFTPLEAIDDHIWRYVKVIQLMAIEAGFQGQGFQPYVLEKLKELSSIVNDTNLPIEIIIDGGINTTTAEKVAHAGADGIAVGSSLWEAPDKNSVIQLLQRF